MTSSATKGQRSNNYAYLHCLKYAYMSETLIICIYLKTLDTNYKIDSVAESILITYNIVYNVSMRYRYVFKAYLLMYPSF
jgi:hypothetical protein